VIGAFALYSAFQQVAQRNGLVQTSDYELLVLVYSVVFGSLMTLAAVLGISRRSAYKAWQHSQMRQNSEGIGRNEVDTSPKSFMDRQFIDMSGAGYCLVIAVTPFIAIPVGLFGLIMCRHPAARKKALGMVCVAAAWLLFLVFAIRAL
jgi:hypothetical protein